MRAAAEGRIVLETLADDSFRQPIERCLGCRACETACPSGVQYGRLLEMARTTIEEQRSPSWRESLLRNLALLQLLPKQVRLRLLARLFWIAQQLGLPLWVSRLRWLPASLRLMAGLLPTLQPRFLDYSQPAPAVGARRGKVAFFYGCIQDAFLGSVNAATVRVLQRNGYEVHFPTAQSCCGAAGLHLGDHEPTLDLARRNIDAFLADDFTAVINNAGGCGATLKEYHRLLAHDPRYADKAQRFVAKVQDITEFLEAHLHLQPPTALPWRVVYIDSCHLRHAQKIVHQPRKLLQSITGLTLVELKQPEMCCGSAGVYNILQTANAEQALVAKLADVSAALPDVVAVANTGCHMQMLYGARKAGLHARVLHIVELLDMAYKEESHADYA
jgi:glycolate oxidase iron-sulfur subunit